MALVYEKNISIKWPSDYVLVTISQLSTPYVPEVLTEDELGPVSPDAAGGFSIAECVQRWYTAPALLLKYA